MKLSSTFSPVVVAAALALGAGMAQARDDSGAYKHGQRSAQNQGGDTGLIDKAQSGAKRVVNTTKRMSHQAADALRETGQKIENRLPDTDQQARVEGPDTRAMGAGRSDRRGEMSDMGDSDRRARMDDAYANWRQQSGSR